jgi:Ca2+-binding RTX toxin-like protein
MNGCQGGCPGGGNALDYSGSPNAINANFPGDTVNGWGLDTFNAPDGFTDIVGSPQGDILTGADNEYNYFTPGAGNDTVVGGGTTATDGSQSDAYDVSDAEDGVTVDLVAGTSKGGSGDDTLTGIEDVYGTEADDVIMGGSSTTVGNYLEGAGGNDTISGGPANANGPDWMAGGSGIDTVDYGLNDSSTSVLLSQPAACAFSFQDFFPAHFHGDGITCWSDANPPAVIPGATINKSGVGAEGDVLIDIENAILGTGNDSFTGSTFNNTVWPNGGQNTLNGCPVVLGGCGIDTVNYGMGYEAGVTVNLAGGGPAGGNADSIVGFSNAVGSPFADTIIGTDANIGNSLKGGKGNDTISGNGGPDFVLGGAGKDNVRGGSGDDTLKGGDANDTIRGSGGDDDIFGQKGKDRCNGGGGNNVVKCEKKFKGASPKAQARATAARIARLVAIKP